MDLHHTAVKEETGFSAVEMLLSLIAVELITFVGFYVYHTQQSAKSTYNAATKEALVTAPKDVQPILGQSDMSKLYLYDVKGAFSIRIPDGWKLHGANLTLLSFSANDLLVTPGTLGGVYAPVATSHDAVATFGLEYQESSQLVPLTNGQVLGLTTKDAVKIDKYRHLAASAPGGTNESVKYSVLYDYYAHYKETRVVHVFYVARPGEKDSHTTVEAMLKTLHFE